MRKFNAVTAGSGGDLLSHSPPCPINNDVLSQSTALKGVEERFSGLSNESGLNGMLQEQSPEDIHFTISGNADDLVLMAAMLKSKQLSPKARPAPKSPDNSGMQNSRSSRPSLTKNR